MPPSGGKENECRTDARCLNLFSSIASFFCLFFLNQQLFIVRNVGVKCEGSKCLPFPFPLFSVAQRTLLRRGTKVPMFLQGNA